MRQAIATIEKNMSARERYQQAVIMLLGTRRTKSAASAVDFVASHAALVDQLRERWAALEDRGALPSPDQVLSWL